MEEQGVISLYKGYVYMNSGNYMSAASEFFSAIQKSPDNAYAYIGYGSALYWLGEVNKAYEQFEKALEKDPKNAVAYQLCGIVKARNSMYEEALKDFLTASKLAPERADIKMNTAAVYTALGNFTGALDNYRKAAELDKYNPLYRYQLGIFYSRLGRYEQAKTELKKAVSLFPQYEDAILELAILAEREDDLNSAVKLYKRALNLKAGDSVARFRLVNILYKLGKYEEIIKTIPRGFLIAPANDVGGISLGIAYSASDNKNEVAQNGTDGRENKSVNALQLQKALLNVSAQQEIKVKFEMMEIPKTNLVNKSLKSENTKMAAALVKPNLNYKKKEYFLPAASVEERNKKIEQIISETEDLISKASPSSDVKINFNMETSTQSDSDSKKNKAKAQYIPRDVGNDMGLWIKGENWLDNVSELLDELSESKNNDRYFKLVRGLGYLIMGETQGALKDFEGDDVVNLLGKSAAYTALGNFDRAKKVCEEVLTLDGKNKIAALNLKWLNGNDEEKSRRK